MKNIISWFSLILIAVSGLARGADTPLTLGVFPYVTRGQLMEFHTPLKLYLEQQLRRPVDMITAPDFRQFMARTQKGEYDIILTAPHLARLAEKRDGYIRIAKTGHLLIGVFLARKDSGIQKLADLKGKTVMMTQPISIVYQMGLEALRQNGLTPGKDVTVVETRTHNNALYAPMLQESDASLTGAVLWLRAEPNVRMQLHEIGKTDGAPGFMLMAHKRLPLALIQQIRSAIFEFDQTAQGTPYFSATKFKDFQTIDDKTMKQMDSYTGVLTEQSP